MPYSAEAFRRAAEMQAALLSGDPGATVAALDKALDPFGVRYYQVLECDAALPSQQRFSALIDKAPTPLMFHAMTARYSEIGDLACELLSVARTFDTDSAQIDAFERVYQAVIDEHRQMGGAGYFITAPTWREQRIAGFATYYFDEAPDQRDEFMALLAVLSQSAFDHLGAPADTAGAANPLTARQREALRHCADGKSDWDIGQLMNVATATAHEHIEAAKRRIGVKTRIQAVLAAYKNGWL